MEPGERVEVVAAAGRALREGRLVIVPTETVYSLAVAARGAGGAGRGGGVAERFAAYAARAGEDSPLAWHAQSAARAAEVLGVQAVTHRRLLTRLGQGPAIFAVGVTPEVLNAAARTLGCETRALDPTGRGEVAVRRTREAAAREVIEAAANGEDGGGVEVLLAEIPLGGARGGWAVEADEARRAVAGALGEEAAAGMVVLDDGRAKPGRAATILHLALGEAGGSGRWEIRRQGAYEERFVRKQLHRTILFVCTGNTCRSPMAEAIAADLLNRERDSALPTSVISAGTGAYTGAPPSEEAVVALRGMGIEPELRGARALTRQMIAEADAIFAMSRSHLQAVLAYDPTAEGKAMLLDPEGGDVPDPIGGPLEVYTETAGRIAEMVAARLRELDS